MTLPVAVREEKIHRNPALEGLVGPLPAEARELAPAELKEASDAFGAALERLGAARAAAREAQAAVEAALTHDQEQARIALGEGKSLPKATAPKAHVQAQEAQRAVPALEQTARDLQALYLKALDEHGEALLREAAAARRVIGENTVTMLAGVETGLLKLAVLHSIEHEFETRRVGAHPSIFLPTRRPRPRGLTGGLKRHVDALRAALGSDG